jgi:hypothetical protein
MILNSMKKLFLPLLLATSVSVWADPSYEFAPNFLTPPPGTETIGNGHGEIAVDSSGNIYVSVEGQKGGLQVYGPDGKYIRHLENTPSSLHGFVIRKGTDGEFIYAAVLGQEKVLKMKLDGTVVLEITKDAFPADKARRITIETKDGQKHSGARGPETDAALTVVLSDGRSLEVPKEQIAKKQESGLKLTNCDAAPNGDIYVVDGYGQSWIFVFDKTGKFKKVFGGPGEPLKLANTHKIFVDTRFEPARLLLCDRGNNRILHLSLEGEALGVVADTGLRRPSSASFYKDLVCIAEIAGRVSVFDKAGKMVAALGVNDTQGQTNTPKVAPNDWREGVVTSPHGITFDNQGNILETEWNQFGRVLRWNLKK